jgi:hypothetical protein
MRRKKMEKENKRKKKKNKGRGGEGKNNGKEKRKIEKEIKKKRGKGIIGISLSYPCDTVSRSCFAKSFSKTDSASQVNPLHQHSHS